MIVFWLSVLFLFSLSIEFNFNMSDILIYMYNVYRLSRKLSNQQQTWEKHLKLQKYCLISFNLVIMILLTSAFYITLICFDYPFSHSLIQRTLCISLQRMGQAEENREWTDCFFFLHIAKKLTNWQTAKVTDDQIHIKTASGRVPSNIVYCK